MLYKRYIGEKATDISDLISATRFSNLVDLRSGNWEALPKIKTITEILKIMIHSKGLVPRSVIIVKLNIIHVGEWNNEISDP